MIDKVRVKKHQQAKIEEWSKALEISESRFIEDAITFYLRHLEGKQQINPYLPPSTPVTLSERDYRHYPDASPTPIDVDEPENFDGGIEL